MSTTKKKTIKFTALMTVLILTVTYFSLLTPTSAYFYKEFSTEGDIKFALFDVDAEEKTLVDEEKTFEFLGATKFADYDEVLFDEVAITREYTVTNVGNVPAKIIPRINLYENAGENGLKYIILTPSSETEMMSEEETVTEEVTIPKGEMKSDIEKTLALFDEETTVEYLNAVSILDAHNSVKNQTIELAPNESVDIKIVFWAEYDAVMSAAGGESAWQDGESVTSIAYKCNIEIIASQLSEKDEAVTDVLAEVPEWQAETTTDQ